MSIEPTSDFIVVRFEVSWLLHMIIPYAIAGVSMAEAHFDAKEGEQTRI